MAITVGPAKPAASKDARTKTMLLPSLEKAICESLEQGLLQPVSTAVGALPFASVTYSLPSSV